VHITLCFTLRRRGFAKFGQTYSKHSGIEAAVHRDLVRPGIIPAELGAYYSWLASLRNTGDYGGLSHVSVEDASKALSRATDFIDTIAKLLD
jgi:uncharacterized protein (UPF0332 family)